MSSPDLSPKDSNLRVLARAFEETWKFGARFPEEMKFVRAMEEWNVQSLKKRKLIAQKMHARERRAEF